MALSGMFQQLNQAIGGHPMAKVYDESVPGMMSRPADTMNPLLRQMGKSFTSAAGLDSSGYDTSRDVQARQTQSIQQRLADLYTQAGRTAEAESVPSMTREEAQAAYMSEMTALQEEAKKKQKVGNYVNVYGDRIEQLHGISPEDQANLEFEDLQALTDVSPSYQKFQTPDGTNINVPTYNGKVLNPLTNQLVDPQMLGYKAAVNQVETRDIGRAESQKLASQRANDSYEAAKKTAKELAVTDRRLDLLDEGADVGAFQEVWSDVRNFVLRFTGDNGIIDTQNLANSEELTVLMAQLMGGKAKDYGPPISDVDMKMMLKSTGSPNMSPKGLRQYLLTTRKQNIEALESMNRTIKARREAGKDDMSAFELFTIPGERKSEQERWQELDAKYGAKPTP